MAFSVKLSRSFSTSALRAKLVQPPVSVFGIDGRYAVALYSAASKQKKLEAVENDIKSLQAMWQKDANLRDYFQSPIATREQKKQSFSGLAKKQSYTDLTENLFASVADNSRYNKLGIILRTYLRLMSAHRGEVLCEITTAKQLDGDSLKQVTAAIQGFVKSGQKLNIETKVDPSIIGGMIVSIGDKYVDMSISAKLKQFARVIEEAF